MMLNGMFWYGLNGLGLVVVMIGFFIVVDMGVVVDCSWIVLLLVGVGGMFC